VGIELVCTTHCAEDKVDERSPQISIGERRNEECACLEKLVMVAAGPDVPRAGEDAHCSECTKYGNVFDVL
jgi:hypothetical protein